MILKWLSRTIGFVFLTIFVIIIYRQVKVDKFETIKLSFSLFSPVHQSFYEENVSGILLKDQFNQSSDKVTVPTQQIENILNKNSEEKKYAQATINAQTKMIDQEQLNNIDLIQLIVSDSFQKNVNQATKDLKNKIGENKVFFVQLVALKNQQKVKELSLFLNEHNFKNYKQFDSLDGILMTKLLVGPYLERIQAEQSINELESLTGLRGIIISK